MAEQSASRYSELADACRRQNPNDIDMVIMLFNACAREFETLASAVPEQRTLLDTRHRPGACQHCGHVDPLRAMQEIGEQLATSSAERHGE